ncbi:hypothetical protein BJP40_06480 [Streptomyces sp. CC53]|uniref:hypothetical protein n=1 Tax=Streptomyces sp. CC53 TaxID=1906740 RepID=UPI0008DCFB0E|nr:hypothetical protein [Streptomyces sp. CC53]OII61169.1 hypothetical protein BJP40_06480 [Streptomyces sp. CC53]
MIFLRAALTATQLAVAGLVIATAPPPGPGDDHAPDPRPAAETLRDSIADTDTGGVEVTVDGAAVVVHTGAGQRFDAVWITQDTDGSWTIVERAPE